MLWTETEGWIGHDGEFTEILITLIGKEVEMRHVHRTVRPDQTPGDYIKTLHTFLFVLTHRI